MLPVIHPAVMWLDVYKRQLDSDPEWKNQFLESVMEHVTYDGEIYAIPTVLSTQVAYYNKEIYDKFNLPIPKTHEEFIEGLKTIRDLSLIHI